MIYSLESQSYITAVPHKGNFDQWRGRLTESEYSAIITDLTSRIQGTEIQTSSWIPGSDWTETVFDPIYSKACLQDERAAAKFFGLIVWQVIMDQPETWAFGRYEKDGVPIEGLTYFRISPPPKA
jgi:hypothetical protein